MTPKPSKLEPRLVPGTGGECKHYTADVLTSTHQTGVFIEPNIDTTCFSLRQLDHCGAEDELEEDLIHFCDWPTLRAAVDQFMADREAE